MSALTFDYQGARIRTAGTPDEPLFVARDVCRALEISDFGQALDRLDEDERGGCSIPTPGGEQTVRCVTESGLYSLILGSRKPEAKAFKRWFTHTVLPAIRKTGRYEAPSLAPVPALPQNFAEALRLLATTVEEKESLALAVTVQAPAVAFAKQVQATVNDTSIGAFAQMIGWGQNRLFKEMRARGYLFYRDGNNVPKQEFIKRGYFKVRETVTADFTHAKTVLTGKGQLWLSQQLGAGYTPTLLTDKEEVTSAPKTDDPDSPSHRLEAQVPLKAGETPAQFHAVAGAFSGMVAVIRSHAAVVIFFHRQPRREFVIARRSTAEPVICAKLSDLLRFHSEGVTVRDVLRARIKPNADACLELLAVLVAAGFLARIQTEPQGGGKPVVRYRDLTLPTEDAR